MVEFGEQLRSARETKGLTQKTLADRLYVSRQTISNWERGERYPDIVTLKKISQLLEVSLDDLLSGKEMVKVVEKKPVIENKLVNGLIAALYAVIVLTFFLKVGEELTLHYVHAYDKYAEFDGTTLADSIIRSNHIFIIEHVVFMLIFSYGLYNALRDILTPGKIGKILMAFFFTFLVFHVGSSIYYEYVDFLGLREQYIVSRRGVVVFVMSMMIQVIIPAVLCILGVLASYLCFIRGVERRLWFNIITVVAILKIIWECFEFWQWIKLEKYYTTFFPTATLMEAVVAVKGIVENAVLMIAIYALIIYQARVLYRKRKLASELDAGEIQNATT